ncbi:MAG TPA: hypothetical protein VGR20_03865 [Acidimicrobiia bacterium]|jgi:hypothetical protein|nr:hypothetical protein [Acidimicrobiia bacterium]
MELLPVFPQPAPVRALPPVVAAGGHGVVSEGWSGGHNTAPTGPPSARVGVEFSHRADGVQVVTFVDMRSGVVISQTPPQQVLAVVDQIMAAIQSRES